MKLTSALEIALSSNSVVYVFGAGISNSLTGRNYGWWQWILDGIHHMKDTSAAKALEDSINVDGSTNNLIETVGKVIDSTKGDGTYDEWMQSGFESSCIVNSELAKALQLLKLPQDIFITTNYDSLLEEAVGLKTFTKDDPGKVFGMIKNGMCSSVVHIHGAYSSRNHIDDIVATKEQYDALYNDEGAQFIQNLFGTRSLVFIGCGQTTDDKNIAHFIRFACNHLNINVPYFYLKRTVDIAPTLPDCFHVIEYGNEYDELAGFILRMAQYRNRKLIENIPIIGRTLHSDTVALGKYHYANEELGFVGRGAELCALNAFLNDTRQTLWWAITGQGGSGKSRLTYEFLKKNERGWFGFFINDATTVTDVESFRPFCNTIVAIDYIQGRESKVAEWTSVLLGRFKQTSFALRILLIERECDKGQGSWYSRLHEAWGKYDRALFESAAFSTVFLTLGDLDDASVSNLVGEVRESHGFPPDTWQDHRLREEYHKKFEKLKYRPLFVQLYVEAWIANKCTEPDYDSLEGVVETALLREQERWTEFFDGDKKVVGSFIRLLIRAAAGGELSEDNIPGLYKEDWENLKEYLSNLTLPGRQRKESCRNFLADLTQNFEQKGFTIKAYYPDIINEYMFAYYADKNINEVVMELWKNAGTEFAVFIQRAQTDFSSNEVIAKIVSDSSEVATAPEMLLARLSRLKKHAVKPEETPESLKANIDKEYDFWHKLPYVEDAGEEQTHEISNAALKLVGLWGCAEQYGALICLDDMDHCLNEIIDMKGKILDILKLKILEERMNACYTTGYTDLARRYEHARRVILDRLAENDSKLADYNVLVAIQENSNRMMDCVFIGEVYPAKEILNGTYKNLDFTNESCVEALAQMAMRYTLFLSQDGALKYENYVKTILKDCQNAFPDNVEIISCIYQYRSFLLQDRKIKLQSGFNDGRCEEQMSSFKDEALQIVSEIEGLGRKVDADTWGVAASVLSALTEEENDIIRLIVKAEEILTETLSIETAKAWMICERKLHELKHEVVSKQIVDEAFAYYLREPSSETTRGQFFSLIDCSTERNKKNKYMLPNVRDSIVQDAIFNPLYSDDAMEQIMSLAEEPGFQKEFFENYFHDMKDDARDDEGLLGFIDGYLNDSFGETGTTVRRVTKIGRNAQCPCGSGKKYKKCCGRNG